MSQPLSHSREHWSSNVGFILAATGSAIGLGNLWKFPFITWENNGGAFVLLYLVCIAAVGLPIMMAELLIGRKTQKSAVGALKDAIGPMWGWVGRVACHGRLHHPQLLLGRGRMVPLLLRQDARLERGGLSCGPADR